MVKFNVFGTKASERFAGLELPEDVKNFGQLVEFLRTKHNIDVTGFKVTWFANGDPLHNSSPETAMASIPTTDGFSIALTPHTTNKGLGYNEMKSFVKQQREIAKETGNRQIYDLIGDYSRLTAAQMTALYNRLQPTNTTATVATVVTNNQASTTSVNELANMEARVGRLEVKFQTLETRISGLAERLSDVDELDENGNNVYEDLEYESSDPEPVAQKPTVVEVPDDILAYMQSKGVR